MGSGVHDKNETTSGHRPIEVPVCILDNMVACEDDAECLCVCVSVRLPNLLESAPG